MTESLNDELFQFVKGTTDAELAFAVFLSKLPVRHREHRSYSCTDLVVAMQKTISQIVQWCDEAGVEEASLLNFAVSDGDHFVATRFCHKTAQASSLYFASGTTFECRDGEYKMETSHVRETSIIVSSEPLTDNDYDWVEVPHCSLCPSICLYAPLP